MVGMSERRDNRVDVNGLMVPDRCKDCPSVNLVTEKLCMLRERLHKIGDVALGGVDLSNCCVTGQDENGVVVDMPLEMLRDQLTDEEIAAMLQRANETVRRQVAEDMEQLDCMHKALQQDIDESTAGCPGVFVMRGTKGGTTITMRACGSPMVQPHDFVSDAVVEVKREIARP